MARPLRELLETLAKLGEDNDARETARPKRMLNITRDTGRVTTLELDPDKIARAGTNPSSAGLTGFVDIVRGKAADALESLPGPFDLVFLDADR